MLNRSPCRMMSSRESALISWLSSAFNHSFSVEETRDAAKLSALVLRRVDVDHFSKEWENVCVALKSYLLSKLELSFRASMVWPVWPLTKDEEWIRVLELVLLCGVNCDDKEKYVECIVGLEEEEQTELMNVIQSLMAMDDEEAHDGLSKTEGNHADMTDLDVNKFIADLNDSQAERDMLKQRCHDMQIQINLLNDEKANLALELQQLQSQMSGKDGNASRSLLLRQHEESGLMSAELKRQVETLQETLYKSELQRDELHSRVDELEKKLEASSTKEIELQKLADEAILLKDEVDILRETAEKAEKFEDVLNNYKKKLEEMGDLRRQLKLLEEKNTLYVQKNVELEEDVKRTGNWRPQMEAFKKQLSELRTQLDSETKKNDKLSFDAKQMREQIQQLQEERSRFQVERDELRTRNDELQDELKFGQLSKHEDAIKSDEHSTLEMIPQNVKERLLRLQHENKVMREKMGKNDDDDKQVLQTIVEDLRTRETKLQTEARKANQRIIELEAMLKNESDKNEQSNLKGDVTLADAYKKITQLEDEVKKKELEIAGMEERYKKYIEKAKSVIKTLDPKQQQQTETPSSTSSGLLQSQLADKNRVIEGMEREAEKSRAIKEMEERLIASAYYNLSMQLHKSAVEQRLANNSGSRLQPEAKHSFLARQRAVVQNRGGKGSQDEFAQYS